MNCAFFISISGECDVWPTLPLCIEKPQTPTRKTLVNKTYVQCALFYVNKLVVQRFVWKMSKTLRKERNVKNVMFSFSTKRRDCTSGTLQI